MNDYNQCSVSTSCSPSRNKVDLYHTTRDIYIHVIASPTRMPKYASAKYVPGGKGNMPGPS